jgi:hypothetical protein
MMRKKVKPEDAKTPRDEVLFPRSIGLSVEVTRPTFFLFAFSQKNIPPKEIPTKENLPKDIRHPTKNYPPKDIRQRDIRQKTSDKRHPTKDIRQKTSDKRHPTKRHQNCCQTYLRQTSPVSYTLRSPHARQPGAARKDFHTLPSVDCKAAAFQSTSFRMPFFSSSIFDL